MNNKSIYLDMIIFRRLWNFLSGPVLCEYVMIVCVRAGSQAPAWERVKIRVMNKTIIKAVKKRHGKNPASVIVLK
jgi:hypothetical protein